MDIDRILSALRQERDEITEAIISLGRVAVSRGKQRGRPPAWMAELRQNSEAGPKRRGRPPGSKIRSIAAGSNLPGTS